MDEIYRQYAKSVYKYLLTLSRDAELAEELTQETFYQAVESIDRFEGRCKISVWLCQIGKHLYYKEMKRRGRQAELCEETADTELLPSPEEDLLASEERSQLLKAVHQLPAEQRELVYLRLFGNLSFREAGEVMGRSENWARVTFYRAKMRLKGGLNDEK